MSEIEKGSISRRDFLRAAGTLGISGGLLGAYAGQALGHNGEDHGSHGAAEAETEHMSSHAGYITPGATSISASSAVNSYSRTVLPPSLRSSPR